MPIIRDWTSCTEMFKKFLFWHLGGITLGIILSLGYVRSLKTDLHDSHHDGGESGSWSGSRVESSRVESLNAGGEFCLEDGCLRHELSDK